MQNFVYEAKKVYDEVVEIRRDVHRNPEFGRQEFRTTALIKAKLEEYGVDEIHSPMETGAVALIYGHDKEGKCVAIRADIDALKVVEETGLPFSSEVPDMMHCCGHDMHTAMLLGVAKILCNNRDKFKGTVKLIFQPSEDTLPGGAKEMVEKGVMENPHVDAIYGIHFFPDEELMGQIGFHSGPLTTSVDLFDVTVIGKGGHGSTPHLTKDPILAACQMVTLLQQISARYIDPMETVIFPICNFHSGHAPNVIPDEAKFGGVARSYLSSVRKEVTRQVFEVAKGVEALSGATVDINHYEGYPACFNDHNLTAEAREVVIETLGMENVIDLEKPLTFSEDFSYFTEMTGTPGSYLVLYGGHEGDGVYPLHNSKCAMKEDAMINGMATLCAVATNHLNNN